MFFRKLHAKVQIIFDMCKYHQFISQILSFYFTILLFLGFIYQLTPCVILLVAPRLSIFSVPCLSNY